MLAGLLVLYMPTYFDLSRTLWSEEEHLHGPIFLVAALWLFWRQRCVFLNPPQQTRALVGGFLLAVGLTLYVLGRSQEIFIFEIGSQIPVLMGVLIIVQGVASVRALWFPLVLLSFMIPLPGLIVDAITGPLKQQISVFAESILYAVGYPIARTGVILTIGPYQLLVADACSGLNSMLSLSALGLFYLYLLHDHNWLKNGLLFACILPIAFTANVIRVITLVLVTYHFGDEAGQGFLHGTAGIVLFAAALILLFAMDRVLGLVFIGRVNGAITAAESTGLSRL